LDVRLNKKKEILCTPGKYLLKKHAGWVISVVSVSRDVPVQIILADFPFKFSAFDYTLTSEVSPSTFLFEKSRSIVRKKRWLTKDFSQAFLSMIDTWKKPNHN